MIKEIISAPTPLVPAEKQPLKDLFEKAEKSMRKNDVGPDPSYPILYLEFPNAAQSKQFIELLEKFPNLLGLASAETMHTQDGERHYIRIDGYDAIHCFLTEALERSITTENFIVKTLIDDVLKRINNQTKNFNLTSLLKKSLLIISTTSFNNPLLDELVNLSNKINNSPLVTQDFNASIITAENTTKNMFNILGIKNIAESKIYELKNFISSIKTNPLPETTNRILYFSFSKAIKENDLDKLKVLLQKENISFINWVDPFQYSDDDSDDDIKTTPFEKKLNENKSLTKLIEEKKLRLNKEQISELLTFAGDHQQTDLEECLLNYPTPLSLDFQDSANSIKANTGETPVIVRGVKFNPHDDINSARCPSMKFFKNSVVDNSVTNVPLKPPTPGQGKTA